MENQETYQEAKKRVQSKIEYRIHLFVYSVASMMLIIINFGFTSESFWAKWPILIGSIIIFWRTMAVFVFHKIISEYTINEVIEPKAIN